MYLKNLYNKIMVVYLDNSYIKYYNLRLRKFKE